MAASRFPLAAFPLATLLLGGCATAQNYDYPPEYAGDPSAGDQGYDGEWNPQWSGVEQPGDLFGGQDVDSVERFYAPLAPYGRWLQTRWGRAFAPDVDRDWRPYTNGRWTEYRLWISDDPWGWATDHYGRWAHDERIGWVWVPDTRWGPHWVAFRENEDYAGWAPIPPGVSFNVGIGFGNPGYNGFGYNDWNSWYAPSWVWAPAGVIYSPGLGRRILPFNRGINYWRATSWQHWTPWQPRRGWVGAPGRNYWRGPSPIGTRIGGTLGYDRPGFARPGYARPGYARPDNRRPDWNDSPRRPDWQDRQDRRSDTRYQDRRPDGSPDGPRRGYGQRPAYADGTRPERTPDLTPGTNPRPDRPNWQDRQDRRRPDAVPGQPGARPERFGGYRQRPAYAEGAAPRADWQGGGRRQPGMTPNAGNMDGIRASRMGGNGENRMRGNGENRMGGNDRPARMAPPVVQAQAVPRSFPQAAPQMAPPPPPAIRPPAAVISDPRNNAPAREVD